VPGEAGRSAPVNVGPNVSDKSSTALVNAFAVSTIPFFSVYVTSKIL
jgi:hypothetical protein